MAVISVFRGILNARINVHSSNNHGEMNLAVVFVTLCSIFIITHTLRIFLGKYAILDEAVKIGETFQGFLTFVTSR